MQDGKILEIVCTTMRIFLTLQSCTGLPGGSVVKSPPANAGDVGTIPGSGRSPAEGSGNPIQYSCLGNPKDRGAWRITVHRVAKRVGQD